MSFIEQLLSTLRLYIGVQQYSAIHRSIVDAYNAVTPIPMDYRVQYDDDWCDVFVTFIADKLGFSDVIGRECGVERHKQLMRQNGAWLGKVEPRAGDILLFDWDKGGFADHIGFVEQVDNHYVHTIEGNSNRQVARNKYSKGDSRIVGYARPFRITEKHNLQLITNVARSVIRGEWGNGAERIRRLTASGYDSRQVQAEVNRLLAQ
ncbi:CHAP domain-containing protein [Tuanshanicoccus yangjingiae]|uniref:CHAP domain-containing protein n=1 Tax=Aerococcaceae bacterium zg-252 TaxID=2796928 RepID=UPI0040647D85